MERLFLMLNIVLLVLGQIMWKIGVSRTGFIWSPKGILHIAANFYIITGCIIYIAATIIWLYLLSKNQMSNIYPLQSLCYILAAFVGVLVFKESVSVYKIVGVILISSGAALIMAV